jgi:tRNA pseudouridine55 synthase
VTAGSKAQDGFILLDKAPGRTSFQSLGAVKKALGTGKVGHTGTLDKFASGLLIALTGRFTRLVPWFMGAPKRYQARIKLGEETDTLDPEGEVIATGPLPERAAFEGALPAFTGEIMQRPPEYSALHVNGKRASDLARQGAAPALAPRPVTVYSLALTAWALPFADIAVTCSQGAYIRSLARDIALSLGTRGRLEALRRTAIGGFTVEEAVDPEALGAEVLRAAVRAVDRGALEALGLDCLAVDEAAARDFRAGRPVRGVGAASAGTSLGIFDRNGAFVGIVTRNEDAWGYGFIYAGK